MSLSTIVMFSNNPSTDCGSNNIKVVACYDGYKNKIIMGNNVSDKIFWHEIGHYIFIKDDDVKKIIDAYPEPRRYDKSVYDSKDKILDEKVADYFVKYRYQPESFKKDYPDIYKIFNNKLIEKYGTLY
jgi:hypothetical protein